MWIDCQLPLTMNCIGIIPSRFGSTRFPGKPLALIGGRPMICHVVERALAALPRVVVATDSPRIAEAAERAGASAIMTSPDIPNGTARVLAAALMIPDCPDTIVNIQGDEPLIDPADIARAVCLLEDQQVDIATIAHRFNPNRPISELTSPNRVKVVTDCMQNALYFSRHTIPYTCDLRHTLSNRIVTYLIHSGLYAYRFDTLRTLVTLTPSPAAEAERLEQLTWLHHAYKIRVAITDNDSPGVDTPDDLRLITGILDR